MRILIIGGVAAGSSAAAKLSRLKPDWDLVIYEETEDISYSSCNMPYFIGDLVDDPEQIAPRDPAYFKDHYNTEVYLHHRVEKINPGEKTIQVHNLKEDRTFEDHYDKLLIATGARASIPPIEGVDQANVFTLRKFEDMVSIHNRMTCCMPEGSSVVVIGAGFIGLEMVENFVRLGYPVKLLVSDQVSKLSKELTPYLEAELIRYGVEIIKDARAVKIQGKKVHLKDGRVVDGDFVLLATGIKPNIELAEDIGLKIGSFGAIETNKQMETSIPDIYAAGDVVQTQSLIDGSPIYLPLGSTANKMGRVVADNMAGNKVEFPGIVGTNIFKLFDLEVGSTGLSEAQAKERGYKTLVYYHIHRSHYASHGGEPILVKAVVDRDKEELLGTEVIGFTGVKNRLDIYASFISFHGNIHDLEYLDTAYAPPFSTVRDVALYTGMIGANLLDKKAPSQEGKIDENFLTYIQNRPSSKLMTPINFS